MQCRDGAHDAPCTPLADGFCSCGCDLTMRCTLNREWWIEQQAEHVARTAERLDATLRSLRRSG